MKIDDLKVFVSVAKAGSLTLASAQLDLAQPNVSRIVRSLEKKLNAELFVRTGRGVKLSAAGTRFFEFASNTVAEFERVESDVGLLIGTAPRRLNIVIPRNTGRLLMPAIFRVFSAGLPNVHLDIIEIQSKDARAALVGKTSDIAVYYDTTHSPFPDQHVLFRESLYLTGHKNHLGDSTAPITLAECFTLPILVFSNPPYARMIERAFETAGIVPEHVEYLENKVAMAAFAIEGRGVAFQALSNIVLEVKNGEICARKVISPLIERNIVCAIGMHVDRNFASKALELMKESLGEVAEAAQWRAVTR